MKTWTEIEEIYRQRIHQPEHEQSAAATLKLVRRLRKHPELSFAYRSIALEPSGRLESLLLWLPNGTCIVHIDSVSPSHFEIYLDRQGVTPETYYSQPERVETEHIIPVIEAYLRRSRKSLTTQT